MIQVSQENIIWGIIVIVIGFVIYNMYIGKKKETFDSTLSKRDSDNAKLILDFINQSNDKTTYVDYINYLVSIKNTNLKIINQETYHELKTLKKLNKLSSNDIMNMMSK